MYRVIVLSNLIFIGIMTITVLCANALGYACCSTYLGIVLLSFVLVQITVVLVLLSLALCNYRGIVDNQKAIQVSTFRIKVHNICIYTWAVVEYISIIVSAYSGQSNSNSEYATARNLILCDIVNLIVVSVMSTLFVYVLFKATK